MLITIDSRSSDSGLTTPIAELARSCPILDNLQQPTAVAITCSTDHRLGTLLMKKQEVKVAPGRPTSEQQELGINSDISRRDFLGGVLVGAGTALLSGNSLASPSLESVDAAREHSFNGFAGPGDYSRSNGNTWEVVSAAHRVRDRAYANASVLDTGESFDLIIVGGGAAGLGAAYYHAKQTGRRARSLSSRPMNFKSRARTDAVSFSTIILCSGVRRSGTSLSWMASV